jgi:hypothetical protein
MIETAPDEMTVGRILFEQGGETALRGALGQGGTTESVEGRLGSLSPRLRAIVINELVTVIAGVLDERVADVLAAGWAKWEALASAARKSLESPGRTEIVELVDHRITSTHRPGVDITVDGVTVKEITLQVDLAIQVHALTAVVLAGRLAALRSGRATLSLDMGLDGVALTSATREIELPIEVRLGEGIPLVQMPETVILPPAPAERTTIG